MRTIVLLSLCYLVSCQLVQAQESVTTSPNLSPRTREYLEALKSQANKAAPMAGYFYKNTATGIYMSGLIQVKDASAASSMESLGVHTGTKAGKIWTVQIPIAKVEAFTQLKGIAYIELDEPVGMKLDSVRRVTHVDSVYQGINLPMPYTGKDVVVGVIDVGFDYTHPTFMDTLGHVYRVKRIWEEKKTGTPPAGFSYGNELTDSMLMKAAQTDNTHASHGTHVTGIAAGSGYGTAKGKFRGMAYESDIVLVGIMPDSSQWQNTGTSDIIDGLNYIYKYAASVGKPAVANLSWGSPVGPRDGSSLFSQACDALNGKGKILIVAAGNDGEIKLHLQKTFTAADTVVSTFVNFDSYLTTKNTWVDMWGETGKTFCANVTLYNGVAGVSTGFVCLDNTVHKFYLIGANNDTCYVTMTASTAEFNGKPRMYLSFGSRTADSICLTVKSSSGQVQLWNGYVRDGSGYFGDLTANGRTWATDGNTDATTTDFVSTQSVISAGAFCAKLYFKNLNNQTYGYSAYTGLQKLVPFSSHGPTADGRVKPDITAPGLSVVSSVNSFDSTYLPAGSNFTSDVAQFFDSAAGKKYYYGQMSGTSMASPCVSGIVALMLQANPNLYPSQVNAILAETAIIDTFTGTLPAAGTNTWGHGKVNAYQAVIAAASYPSGITNVSSHGLNCTLYPNPNNGEFIIDYTGAKTESLTIEMFDVTGKKILSDTWKVNSGSNQKSYSLTNRSQGIYFTRIASDSGSSVIKTMVY